MVGSNNPESEPGANPRKRLGNEQNNKVKIIYIVIAVLLAGGLAAIGWMYYDSTKKLGTQKALIDSLEERLRDSGITADVIEPESGGAACSGGSSYSADIGNFEIAVSDPNVIIRDLDANFEGGPITDLIIGYCVAGETNVVDNYILNQVNILAHPAANATELRTNFEAQWGSPLTAGATVTIDGVTAQIYTGEGLFMTKLLYFDHNGIGYQIELPSTNPTSEATLTDVISDWSFTP